MWWLLAREPALPEESQWQISAELAQHAQWCRAMMFGDAADGLHLELLVNALDEATSLARDPLGLATAEQLLRGVCRKQQQDGSTGADTAASTGADTGTDTGGITRADPGANLPPTDGGVA